MKCSMQNTFHEYIGHCYTLIQSVILSKLHVKNITKADKYGIN